MGPVAFNITARYDKARTNDTADAGLIAIPLRSRHPPRRCTDAASGSRRARVEPTASPATASEAPWMPTGLTLGPPRAHCEPGHR